MAQRQESTAQQHTRGDSYGEDRSQKALKVKTSSLCLQKEEPGDKCKEESQGNKPRKQTLQQNFK